LLPLQKHELIIITAIATIITAIDTIHIDTLTRAGLRPGAGGTCAARSAKTRGRSTILHDPGLTMDQTPAVRPLARSSSGVTTSERSSAARMANGSFAAEMTGTPCGPARDPWQARSPSEPRTHAC